MMEILIYCFAFQQSLEQVINFLLMINVKVMTLALAYKRKKVNNLYKVITY